MNPPCVAFRSMPAGASPGAQRHGPPPPDVSVVIPTYLRPHLLARCLWALFQQDLEPWRFEILVCDDASSDATRKLVACFAAAGETRGLAVTYLPMRTRRGPAAARNRGWRVARGRVIAFTDDDTVPDSGWLFCGFAAIESGNFAAVSGRIEVPLPSVPTDYERDTAGLATSEFATANCFVRRQMLAWVGGFDERYTSPWREDSDLQFSILRAGGRIVRCERARVVHPVRPARWGISLFQSLKSRFDALLFKKYPELYRLRIAAAPPWNYYLMVASLGAAAAAGWLGATAVAWCALGSWAALTAAFAVRRMRGTSRHLSHIAEMVVTSVLLPPVAIASRLYGAFRFRTRFL